MGAKGVGVVAAVTVLLIGSSTARSDPHESIRRAVVHVTAMAMASETSRCPGCNINSIATGFYINPNGRIATVHHLLDQLAARHGGYDANTLEFEVRDDPWSLARPAEVDYIDAMHDLLVLRMPAGGATLPYLKVAENPFDQITLSVTPLFTLGFPEAYASITDQGFAKSFDGPEGHRYLWVTSLDFKNGQSGSPIYLENGGLVGIAKGFEKGFPSNSFIIPASYLDHLAGMESLSGSRTVPSDSLGDIQVFAEIVEQVEEREFRRVQFEEENQNCGPRRAIKWRVNTTSGWSLAADSIHWFTYRATAGSHVLGTENIGEGGFSVVGELQNRGECGLREGAPFVREDLGALKFEIQYAETRIVPQKRTEEIARRPAQIGVPISLVAPEGTERVTAKTVKVSEGSPTEFNLGIVSDLLNRVFIITPEMLAKDIEIHHVP